jgi:hypothetical protein
VAAVKAGAVLIIGGVWVLAQIFGGHALQRLGVLE